MCVGFYRMSFCRGRRKFHHRKFTFAILRAKPTREGIYDEIDFKIRNFVSRKHDRILRQKLANKLDKFAFMVVSLFLLLPFIESSSARMFHSRCGFHNVVLEIYFSGFAVSLLNLMLIALCGSRLYWKTTERVKITINSGRFIGRRAVLSAVQLEWLISVMHFMIRDCGRVDL